MTSRGFNWGPGLFIIIYHLLLLVIVPLYFLSYSPSLVLCLIAIALFFMTGMSITGGYHRLYAHRAYRAHWVVEALLLWFGSLAAQGSVLRWGFDHRLHHAHTDTHDDPYSINRGFWYAHMLWIFRAPLPIDSKVVPDLINNRMVRFQDTYYPVCMFVSNLVTCGLVGWLLGDFVGAFVIAGLVRMFSLHHVTWLINSAAHTWGWKPFCQEQSAVDNFFLSLVTFGEGYHNYHHTFANDYRNGVRWYHFDPTKWMIWTLSKLGLASHLRQTDQLVIKRRMVLERKSMLMQRLETAWEQGREELQLKVQELSDRLLEHLTRLNDLRKQMAQSKEQPTGRELIKDLMGQMRSSKRALKQDWHQWTNLSKNILQQAEGGT